MRTYLESRRLYKIGVYTPVEPEPEPEPQGIKAFPTAYGGGADSIGGRDGQVIHVTTLNWDGPGSLKEAIQTTGPRIIVFDVSGEIDATSEGIYTPIINGSDYDNITIAGQTAPFGGISIRTSEFMFRDVSNVIIRYIRFRNAENSNQDALWFTGGNNIIFDHCTFSHGGDEAGSLASGYGRPQDPIVIMGDITIQNCFFQDSSTGSIIGTETQIGDFTIVNNLFSNISHRFPNPKGEGQYDIINNVVYNWKYRLIRITGGGTYNVINNYYKGAANGIRQPGWFNGVPITSNFLQKVQTQADVNPLIYAAGSIITEQRETPLADDRDMWTVFAGSHLPENTQVPNQYFTSTQFPLVGKEFTIKTGQQTYIDVLADVGANKTLNADGTINHYQDDKDAADIIMIQNDTYSGNFYNGDTYIYPVVPQNTRPIGFYGTNQHIPQAFLTARGVNNTLTVHNELAPSGYTWLEEYMNQVDKKEVKAFPTAYGAGAYSSGGRGGQIIHVTTLNWDGPGSLKEAIQTPGPRIIVFDVSGEIDATSEGIFTDIISGPAYNDITIAGQTAPHGGISIRTSFFRFENVENIIIRHIRFRHQWDSNNYSTMWLRSCRNYIMDHCTISHGGDEAADFSSSDTPSGNGTIQNCFFQDSQKGVIVGTDTRGEPVPEPDLGDFTFVNNVFHNISHRFPNPQGRGQYDIINNIVYNWKERIVRITQDGTYNVLNNYYKPSLEGLRRDGWFSGNADLTVRLNKLQLQLGETPLIHTKGNIVTGQRETPLNDDSDMWQYFAGSNEAYPVGSPVALQYFTPVQFELAGVPFNIKSANQAYTDVLSDVGANKTLNADGTINAYQDTKDSADILMIQNDSFVSYDNGFTYTPVSAVPYPIIPQNTRISGFYGTNQHIPQAFLTARGVNNTLTVHNELAPSGYTWLEEYLNQVDV